MPVPFNAQANKAKGYTLLPALPPNLPSSIEATPLRSTGGGTLAGTGIFLYFLALTHSISWYAFSQQDILILQVSVLSPVTWQPAMYFPTLRLSIMCSLMTKGSGHLAFCNKTVQYYVVSQLGESFVGRKSIFGKVCMSCIFMVISDCQ